MNYLLAKTFKEGSVAIPLENIPDFLAYSAELQETYKRKVEVLVVSAQEDLELDQAWPEHAPVLVVETKESLEKALSEKLTKKDDKKAGKKGGKKR